MKTAKIKYLDTSDPSKDVSRNDVAIWDEIYRMQLMIQDLKSQLNLALRHQEIKNTLNRTIIINTGNTSRFILHEQIVMLEATSNYSSFFLADGSRILTPKILKYWECVLSENEVFIRTHRSFLVNTAHILSYCLSTKKMTLTGGLVASVNRRFKF